MALPDRRLAAVALVVCLGLAVAHTWPLATNPARLSRHDNADTMLNEWIVAWVAHQLPRDPVHLFDANIFYPEPRALAFSEHLVVQGAMAAPLLWLGASPVAAYNVLIIVGLALSAWTLWLVVQHWTGSVAAGAVAGSLLAFNAHTLTRLPHMQALHIEFLPLALLALDRMLMNRRTRDAVALAVLAALQALTSNYLLVFTAFGLTACVLARPREWLTPPSARGLTLLGLSALGGAVLVAPFLVPYYLAQREQGLTRTIEEVARYSSTWRDYLFTAGRLHFAAWSARFSEGSTALFPGVLASVLAVVAIAGGRGLRDPRVRMVVVMGLMGVVLSFGPAVPGYDVIYRVVPLLQGVRGAARFGFLLLVAVAVLAGFGVAAMRERWGRRRWWPLVVAAVLIIVHLEALRAPMTYRPFDGVPAIYRTLASEPGAVVAEFPFNTPATAVRNAPYVLNSTAHWKPLLNGYSGFIPASYALAADSLRAFPDARSRDRLRATGVTHVFIHLDAYGDRRAAMTAALADAEWLTLLAAQGGIRLYRVER